MFFSEVVLFGNIVGQVKEPFFVFVLFLADILQVSITDGCPSSFPAFASPVKRSFKVRLFPGQVFYDVVAIKPAWNTLAPASLTNERVRSKVVHT